MNIEEIKKEVAHIDQAKDDPEYAHESEDRLFRHFIYAIADRKYDSLEEIEALAIEVAKSSEISFPRRMA